MTILRPTPEASRAALEWAAMQTGWTDAELLIDTAAEKLTHFSGSDEAVDVARHYLRKELAGV